MIGPCSGCCQDDLRQCFQCCPDKPTQVVFSISSPETTGDPRQDPEDETIAASVTCPEIDEEIIVDIEQTVIDRYIDEFTFDGATSSVPLTVNGQPVLGPILYRLWIDNVPLSAGPGLGSLFQNTSQGAPVVQAFSPTPQNGSTLRGVIRGGCGVDLSLYRQSTKIVESGSAGGFLSIGSEVIGGRVTLTGFFAGKCEPGGCLQVAISERWYGTGFSFSAFPDNVCDDGDANCGSFRDSRTYVSLASQREEPTVTANVITALGEGEELEVTLAAEQGEECRKDSGVFQNYWTASAKAKKDSEGSFHLPGDRVVFETADIGGPVLTPLGDPPKVTFASTPPALKLLARSGEGAELTAILTANPSVQNQPDTFGIESVQVTKAGAGYLEGDRVFIECDYRAIALPANKSFPEFHPDLRVRLADLQPPTVTIDPLDTALYPCLEGVTLEPTVQEVRAEGFTSSVEFPRQFLVKLPGMLLPQSQRPVLATCPDIPDGTRIPLNLQIDGGFSVRNNDPRYFIEFKGGDGKIGGFFLETRLQPTIRGPIGEIANTSKGLLMDRGFYRKLVVASVDGEFGKFYKLGEPAACSDYESWTLDEESRGIPAGGNYSTQNVSGNNGPSFFPSLVRVCPTPTVTLTIQ